MKESVYLLKLEFENIRCFGDKATLDLSDGNNNWKKWTVILGDNGTGKTSLLQILVLLKIREDQSGKTERYEIPEVVYYIHHFYQSFKSQLNIDNIQINFEYLKNRHKENGYLSIQNDDLGTSFSKIIPIYMLAYGATRVMGNNSLAEFKSESSETLFSEDAKLINAEEWLLQLDYAASKESEIRDFAINKRNQVKQILIDLLPDIEEIRFTTPTKENLKSTVEFKSPLGWVTIHQLSLGYKTMVAWMVDLAARMFERYPESENPLAEPAIVLVDEIDLHLHPKWQRKIFDYLSEKFPKTQFIVTAHSPLIVQSAPKDANIVVLRKEGDYVVIDNDVESVQNWRLDQILSSDLFGIESARGPETEKWLKERKELLQKERLTNDEEIKLNELNKKAHSLPTADNQEDIKAMEIIRKAADFLKSQKV